MLISRYIENINQAQDFAKRGAKLFIDRKPTEKENDDFCTENGLGYTNIKVGDRFEGWACSYFFEDQICTHIDGDMLYGTTTLVIFNKKYIRLID